MTISQIILSDWLKLKKQFPVPFHPWKPYFFILQLSYPKNAVQSKLLLSYYNSSGGVVNDHKDAQQMIVVNVFPIKTMHEFAFVVVLQNKQHIKLATSSNCVYENWLSTIRMHVDAPTSCPIVYRPESNCTDSPPYESVPSDSKPIVAPCLDINDTLTLGKKSLVDETKGFIIPHRENLDDRDIVCRCGKSNYALANLTYVDGKSTNHAEDSLEFIIENLVKTWEKEATHKSDYYQWTTVQHDVFCTTANNGNTSYGAKGLGSCNMLLDGLYDNSTKGLRTWLHHIEEAFPKGLVWELLEIYCGPPKIAFTWRHWGHFDGEYNGNKGKGELVELFGWSIAVVNGDLKMQSLEVFYQPQEFLKILEGPSAIQTT